MNDKIDNDSKINFNPEAVTGQPKPKARRGFAVLKEKNPELLKQIATKGGASVEAHNRSFSKDSRLAREAGMKGGMASKGGGRPKSEV